MIGERGWNAEVAIATYHLTLRDLHGLRTVSDASSSAICKELTSNRSATASSPLFPPARVFLVAAFDRPDDYRIEGDGDLIDSNIGR